MDKEMETRLNNLAAFARRRRLEAITRELNGEPAQYSETPEQMCKRILAAIGEEGPQVKGGVPVDEVSRIMANRKGPPEMDLE